MNRKRGVHGRQGLSVGRNAASLLKRSHVTSIKRKYQFSHDFTDGVTNLNLAEHATYTEEEPNALLPEEVAPFLTAFRESHPEHFAMVYLGLVTGLRPSSLRPLRRRGSEPDVVWEANRILVRRSHTEVSGEEPTLGGEVPAKRA